ncbi:MAG: NAD(P)/FAD-dependent oxidoreductase [bacterium]
MRDVIVIGSGPSGIFAAIAAANSGSKVLLIEKNNLIGRKILATGNGRCNLTNETISADNYHGSVSNISMDIIGRFNQIQTIKYFNGLGVVTKKEDRGRIFPATNQASTIVTSLSEELKHCGVKVLLDSTVKNIEVTDNYVVFLENGTKFESKTLILATGGRAAHQFGSSGDGLFWAKKLGHNITEIYAALTPIEIEESFISKIMGVKFPVTISATVRDEPLIQRSGDIIFTHFGISGPAAMSIAGIVAPKIGKEVIKLSIDLIPNMSEEELDKMLLEQIEKYPKKSAGNIIAGVLPKSVAELIASISKLKDNQNASEISRIQRLTIINNIKFFSLTVKSVRPLKEAQVTSGGIPLSDIDGTLQSRIIPKLYFAGEILDIDGDSGGYNLQWAWSSGKIAGEYASKNAQK